MAFDFQTIPGYRRNTGPPDDFEIPDVRLWDANELTNVRFGIERAAVTDAATERLAGRFYARTLQRVRAKELVGASGSIGGGPYDTGWSPYFHLFLSAEQSWTIQNPPLAAGDVNILGGGSGDYAGLSKKVDLTLNGTFIGEMQGRADGNGLSEVLVVSATLWNQILGDADEATLGFVPVLAGHQPEAQIHFRIQYQSSPEEVHQFVNDEVTFVHHGYGLRRAPNGRFEMVSLYQPDKADEVLQAYGSIWRAPSTEPTGLGVPGRFYFVLPFRTPPSMEGYFSAHNVVCGIIQ